MYKLDLHQHASKAVNAAVISYKESNGRWPASAAEINSKAPPDSSETFPLTSAEIRVCDDGGLDVEFETRLLEPNACHGFKGHTRVLPPDGK